MLIADKSQAIVNNVAAIHPSLAETVMGFTILPIVQQILAALAALAAGCTPAPTPPAVHVALDPTAPAPPVEMSASDAAVTALLSQQTGLVGRVNKARTRRVTYQKLSDNLHDVQLCYQLLEPLTDSIFAEGGKTSAAEGRIMMNEAALYFNNNGN